MKIIAISGWKRSGKDTVANYLIKVRGFKRVGFADPLKDMVADEYDIPIHFCYEDEFKEKPLLQYPVDPKDSFTEEVCNLLENEFKPGPDGDLFWTPRALCILKGSINRAVTSSYWVQRALKKMDEQLRDPFNNGVVISDLRYRSEVEQLKEKFGNDVITVRVNRFDSIDTNDPSERDLDNYKFDYVLNNTTSLEELYLQVEEIIDGLDS